MRQPASSLRGPVLFLLLLLPTLSQAQWPIPIPVPPVPQPVEIPGGATDPAGDNINNGPDVLGLNASTINDQLLIRLELAERIVPGQIDLAGGIDLDINRSGSNGDPTSLTAIFCPQPAADFGPEFAIDLFSINWQQASAEVIRLPDRLVVGSARLSVQGSTLNLVINNRKIADDGILNLAAVVGTRSQPSDCIPDGAVVTSRGGTPAPLAVPALNPLALVLLTLGLLQVAGWRLRPN
ncbi:MAG: hypothetical protein Tsb002_05640 [Wenzhouxiangellaceae bacterium]